MQKNNSEQIEIFSLNETPQKNVEKRKSFLTFIWGHEKIVLSIICLLIICVVSYSLGFEKGKKSALLNKQLPQKKDEAVLPVKKETVIKQLPVKIPITVATTKISTVTAQKNYTIQVATFKSETFAKKEAESLKNKGFQTIIVPKNNYVQLCVGQFIDREEASTHLRELKKKYLDCFIRRL